jgi:hypothetical protein
MRVIIKATFLSVQRALHNKHQHGEQTCLGIAGVFGAAFHVKQPIGTSRVAMKYLLVCYSKSIRHMYLYRATSSENDDEFQP